MNIKRAFYAMLVLLLPLTALAQPTIPTPAQGTAIIAVSKYFNNGDDGTVGEPINLHIQCDGGSISPSNAIEVTQEDGKYEAAFVVFNLGVNQTTECKVWEEPVDGYTPEYYCDFGEYAGYTGADADPSCVLGEEGPSADACQFNAVTANVDEDPTPGSQAGCTIYNQVDPVEIELTKVWEVFGHPGDDFSTNAYVFFTCDAPIVGGSSIGNGYYRVYKSISSYVDGVGTTSASVYPEWFDDDSTTTCWVNEYGQASGVEVDETDCQGLSVAIGSEGVGCTITNTMFFEGIPTLNQYGMAILALLMLGVGFVGFRRFV